MNPHAPLVAGEEWTVRAALFETIESRLRAAGVAVEIEVMPSGDPCAFPAVHVFDQGDMPVEEEVGTHRFRLALTVEFYVEGEGGMATHAAACAAHAGGVRALFAGSDAGQVLDGLAEEIILGRRTPSVADLADRRCILVIQEFFVIGATRRGDPARAA